MIWSRSVLRIAFGNDFFRSGRFWVPLVLLVLAGALVFSCVRWEWIRSGSEIRTESLGTGVIITNIVISILLGIAVCTSGP